MTPTRTEIIILATRTQNVLGEKGRRIRELTAVVQKRFNFPEGTVEVRLCWKLFVCLHNLVHKHFIVYTCVMCVPPLISYMQRKWHLEVSVPLHSVSRSSTN